MDYPELICSLAFSAGLLDTAIKVLPFVITASGRVGADTPINCKDSGLQGVIVEVTVSRLIFGPSKQRV